MITLRRDSERRHIRSSEHDIWGTFYPQEHLDPLADGFGILALFNETRLPPGGALGPYRSDEAEVVTYVYKGALAQEDSTGSSGVICAGEFQRMTSGRAIRCKETNASRTDWAHVFRISLRPSEVGLACAHERKRFTAAQRRNVLCVVASVDARNGSLHIHQDALIHSSILDPGRHLVHRLLPGRSVWLHIICGEATLSEVVLTQGDGVGVMTEPTVSLTVQENTEILLVDLGPQPSSLR
jgi:redox-sensitive bicupin YhaK (pirin superfamily)